MSQATLSLNIDSNLKERWFSVCDELGVNISTVVTMLAKKMSREKRIPFEVSIDPFYGESNINALNDSYEQLCIGKTVTKTIDELESME